MLVKKKGGFSEADLQGKTHHKVFILLSSQGLLQPGSGVLFSLPVSKPHELGLWDKTLGAWD